jgi:hypothetical protein
MKVKMERENTVENKGEARCKMGRRGPRGRE